MTNWFRYRWRKRVVIDPTVPVWDSDARRADAPSRSGEPDPELARAAKLRRRGLHLFFYAVFCTGVLGALMGQNGYFDLLRLRAEHDEARRGLLEQQVRVDELRRAIQALENDPLARERIAREELNLGYPGEIQFLLPREDVWLEGPLEAPFPDLFPDSETAD